MDFILTLSSIYMVLWFITVHVHAHDPITMHMFMINCTYSISCTSYYCTSVIVLIALELFPYEHEYLNYIQFLK